MIYDNSDNKHELIAEGIKNSATEIIDRDIYLKIYHGK
jgi:hypothetical protein